MSFKFEYDDNAIDIATAAVAAIYKGQDFFYKPGRDIASIQRFETSLPSLNWILSGRHFGDNCGLPMGKLINVYGPSSSGKTTLCYQLAGEIVKAGGRVGWIDKESSFDSEYAAKFGIDADNPKHISLSWPDYSEQAFDTMYAWADAKSVSLIVVDSVDGLVSMNEEEKAAADTEQIGSQAKPLTRHLKKMINKARRANITVLYINQLRNNLTMGGSFGKKFTNVEAMKFYPHIQLEVAKDKTKAELYDSAGNFIGINTGVCATKNKTAAPFNKFQFQIIPGQGFSKETDTVFLGLKEKVVTQKGNWFYFGEQALGNGINMARLKLVENPELYLEINGILRNLFLHKYSQETITCDLLPEITELELAAEQPKKIKLTGKNKLTKETAETKNDEAAEA